MEEEEWDNRTGDEIEDDYYLTMTTMMMMIMMTTTILTTTVTFGEGQQTKCRSFLIFPK